MLKNNYSYLVLIYVIAFLLCAITAFAGCRAPSILNMTKIWNKHDQETLNRAADKGCRQHFPDMPCLKLFIKLNENDYSVICSKESGSTNSYGVYGWSNKY